MFIEKGVSQKNWQLVWYVICELSFAYPRKAVLSDLCKNYFVIYVLSVYCSKLTEHC